MCASGTLHRAVSTCRIQLGVSRCHSEHLVIQAEIAERCRIDVFQ